MANLFFVFVTALSLTTVGLGGFAISNYEQSFAAEQPMDRTEREQMHKARRASTSQTQPIPPEIAYEIWINSVIHQGTLPDEKFIAQEVRDDHIKCGLELKAKVRELTQLKERRP